MKKSQVLAALALAFALGLGVVAPVANTYAEGGIQTYGSFGTTEEQKASSTDVLAAVNTIKRYNKYIAYNDLAEAQAQAIEDTGAFADIVDMPSLKENLTDELTTLKVNYGSEDDLATIITTAKTSDKYNYEAWVNLLNKYNAANAVKNVTDTNVTDPALEALKSAIQAIRPDYNMDDKTIATAISTAENLAVKNADNAVSTIYTFGNMRELIGAISAAQTGVDTVKALSTTLGAVNEFEANEATRTAQATAIENAVKGNTPIATLRGLANNVMSSAEGVKFTTLQTKVNAAADADYSKQSEYQNWMALEGLKTDFKAFAGAELNITPSTPGEGENKPGDGTGDTTTETTIQGVVNGLGGDPIAATGKFKGSVYLRAATSDKEIKAFGSNPYALYDITIVDDKGEKAEFEGMVKVTMTIPENIDASKGVGIYYVNAEGEVEKLAADVKDGKISFSTTHFSLYAIVQDGGVNLAPEAGVLAAADGTASSTVAIVAGIATALTAAGAGVVAYRNARRAGKEA